VCFLGEFLELAYDSSATSHSVFAFTHAERELSSKNNGISPKKSPLLRYATMISATRLVFDENRHRAFHDVVDRVGLVTREISVLFAGYLRRCAAARNASR
jgi:hypothetical protein